MTNVKQTQKMIPLVTCEISTVCGEGEDVVVVHTLPGGVVQVRHELLVVEEEEEEEQERKEEQEVERESQSEENTRTWMTMWMV